MMDMRVTRPVAPVATSATNTALAAVAAILFGAFLIFGVGFAAPAALHNAAHDGRHSFAFPCH